MSSYSFRLDARSASSGDLGDLGRLKVATWPTESLSLMGVGLYALSSLR
jgi:hypothetical protein